MLIPIVLVPVILGLKHARLERELEHAERMKALELGRKLPADEPMPSPLWIIGAIGAGVPIGVFFCVFIAAGSLEDQTPAWVAAGIVGLAGVVSGSLLAHRHLLKGEVREDLNAKPSFDADAFDVVGTRG
jgi:hypothetical protein